MPSHATPARLEHYLVGQLSIEDSNAVRAHLEECEECQLRLAEIAMENQWAGPERRSEPRVVVDFAGHLKLLDPVTSVGPPHDVRVIEISRRGLKIRTPRFLIPKSQVQIRFNDQQILGEVRYCTKTASGYDAGIQQRNGLAGPS